MEITKMLTLSTAHIPESIAKSLETEPETDNFGLSVYPFAYGFWIFIPDYGLRETIPKPLAACLRLAKENGCEWLRLDCDAEPLDELPVYDW